MENDNPTITYTITDFYHDPGNPDAYQGDPDTITTNKYKNVDEVYDICATIEILEVTYDTVVKTEQPIETTNSYCTEGIILGLVVLGLIIVKLIKK